LEIYYKVERGTLIYLLSPCHVLNFYQIYFLTTSSNQKKLQKMFRIHIHLTCGALLAMLFPVTNTRFSSLEVTNYWLQHLIIYLVVPMYLYGAGHRSESFSDLDWPLMSCGYAFLYHFGLLQIIGLMTDVNLNNMLCPAPTDPFYGINYRLWSLIHMHIVMLVHAKLYPPIIEFLNVSVVR